MHLALVVASAALLRGAAGAHEKGAVEPVFVRAAQTPDEKLKALIERHDKLRKEVLAEYRKTEDEKERGKILAKLPGKDFAAEFRALAEASKGTETAAQAWVWVLRLDSSDSNQCWQIIQTMLEEHMQSSSMLDIVGQLRYGSSRYGEANVLEALRAVAAEATLENVRAASLFTLGAVLLDAGDASRKQEGRDCLEAVIAKYPSVIQRGERTYKSAAEAFLFELDHLQIGMPAPDFQSVDENGVAWKLSDYRGKVVIVDFWGNW